MDHARQHWLILQQVDGDLAKKVQSFMVIGDNGDGAIMLTQDGEGYWIGRMQFGNDSKQSKEATRLLDIELNLSDLIGAAHGRSHILLLNGQGQIYAMGKNNCGQMGHEKDDETHYVPKRIVNQRKFVSIRCGSVHNLALTDDGKVWSWGGNLNGQVGVHSASTVIHSSLQQVTQLNPHRVVSIECGGAHSLALTDQGAVYAWGWNYYGQLGHNNCDRNVADKQMHFPVRISITTYSPIKSMAGGRRHTLLLTESGKVFACGWNKFGQIGQAAITKCNPSLCQVDGLPPITAIASHFNTSLSIAMSVKRECFIWGYLGDNTSTSTPLKLSPYYMTIDSAFSSRTIQCNTPYTVPIEAFVNEECPGQNVDSETQTEPLMSKFPELTDRIPSKPDPERTDSETQTDTTIQTPITVASNRWTDVVCRMFDNPDSNPDVKFLLGDQTILAHRCLLQFYSGHFDRLFSEFCRKAELNPLTSITTTIQSDFGSSPRRTTNPSNIDEQSILTPPIPSSNLISIPSNSVQSNTASMIVIRITPYSYSAFYAYLRYLYTNTFEISPENVVELFELANISLESDLMKLCLDQIQSSISVENCCQYYQFANRYQLSELERELVTLIAKNPLPVFRTEGYRSIDLALTKKLTVAIGDI